MKMPFRKRTVFLNAASQKRLEGPKRCSAEDGLSGHMMAKRVKETTKYEKEGDALSRHSVRETTAGTLHLTPTSAPRRCYFAIAQYHTEDFLESVPPITSKPGRATIPELQFSSELFVFYQMEPSAWHKWPWGREQ